MYLYQLQRRLPPRPLKTGKAPILARRPLTDAIGLLDLAGLDGRLLLLRRGEQTHHAHVSLAFSRLWAVDAVVAFALAAEPSAGATTTTAAAAAAGAVPGRRRRRCSSHIGVPAGARPCRVRLLRRLHPQRCFRQPLHNLVRQKAEDVDHVVAGLAIGHDAETSPLAEALALAEGETRLSALAPVDVLLFGHALGALVGVAQALQCRGVHLRVGVFAGVGRGGSAGSGVVVIVVVEAAVALGDGVRIKRMDVPRETDLRLFMLGDAAAIGNHVVGVGGGARRSAARIVGEEVVRFAGVVVGLFDVLAHVLPRQELLHAVQLRFVVADDVQDVGHADGALALSIGDLGAPLQDLFDLLLHDAFDQRDGVDARLRRFPRHEHHLCEEPVSFSGVGRVLWCVLLMRVEVCKGE